MKFICYDPICTIAHYLHVIILVVELVTGKFKLEASGGLTLDNAKSYADTGVDYLAVGALTHSAPAFDIGLDFREEK